MTWVNNWAIKSGCECCCCNLINLLWWIEMFSFPFVHFDAINKTIALQLSHRTRWSTVSNNTLSIFLSLSLKLKERIIALSNEIFQFKNSRTKFSKQKYAIFTIYQFYLIKLRRKKSFPPAWNRFMSSQYWGWQEAPVAKWLWNSSDCFRVKKHHSSNFQLLFGNTIDQRPPNERRKAAIKKNLEG